MALRRGSAARIDPRPEARALADQAFSRAAGAPLLAGNEIRLLKDASENYPAWLTAIGNAERSVLFENYIIHDDVIGRQFADALIARARAGVRVRLLYDWVGALGAAGSKFWRMLREGGIEVRCFNPPQLDSPLGWISRDHRKSIIVDNKIGFVSGLCLGKEWVGDPAHGIEPWRDTGVSVRGPAVADLVAAFARAWATTGEPMSAHDVPSRESMPSPGNVTLRVVADMPNVAGLYRLDQLIAAGARKSLWLTDAYYVGTPLYVQALRASAMDGVDVRLLVPGASSDVAIVQALSRSGYRPLLDAGVRVFEWNGPMLHAKTSVADGRWARVGSSNLNPASWLGNWELDVAVEDEGFGAEMQAMYLDDLRYSTEIVLGERRRVRRATNMPPVRRVDDEPGGRSSGRWRRTEGSAGRLAAGVITIGGTVGAAITDRRTLGPAEARTTAIAGFTLLLVAVVAVLWPRVIAIPLGVIGAWLAMSLLITARRLHSEATARTRAARALQRDTR